MTLDTDRFWEQKSLEEMTRDEWESVCDGCGKCCTHKFENPESGDIEYTNVACSLLDLDSIRCKHYADRQRHVPGCLCLTPQNVRELTWLPETCAYRRLALGQGLPDWHPLLTGDRTSTLASGMSVLGHVICEDDAEEFQAAKKFGILG